MNKQYFPHMGGGSENPKATMTFEYNIKPSVAVSSDPRTIITEWSDAALKTLFSSEVYEGQKIFCIDDRYDHLCLWVPTKGVFSGYNCLWSQIKTESDWVDISTYTPTKSTDELIAEKVADEWKFSMNSLTAYCGFYKFESEDIVAELSKPEVLNDVMKHVAMYSDTKNANYISASFANRTTKGTVDKTMAVTSTTVPSTAAKTAAIGSRFVVICPSKSRGGDTGRCVSAIKYGSDGDWKGEITDPVQDVNLGVINILTYEIDTYKFDIYVGKWENKEEIINGFVNGTVSYKISFTEF